MLALIRDIPTRFRRVTKSTGYMSQIDGLRFLAIMPVVFYHTALRGARLRDAAHPLSDTEIFWKNLFPIGEIGVTLFFFISGYIIAFPFMKALWHGADEPSKLEFYRRRLLRLGPPYVVALLLCYLMLAGTGFAPKDAPKFNAIQTPLHESLLASLFYVHNLWFGASSRLDPPLWTLEIEMQFYVLAPFLIAGYCAIRNATARRALGLAAIVLGLCMARSDWLDAVTLGRLRWSVLSYFQYFFAGIIMCDVVFGRDGKPWTRSHGADLLLAIGFAVLLLTGMPDIVFPTAPAMLREAVRLVAILAVFYGGMAGSWGSRFLGAPWIALIGGMCYSIYLIHVPLIQICAEIVRKLHVPASLPLTWAMIFALALPVVLIAGLIFYIFVEYPAMFPDWPKRLRDSLAAKLGGGKRASEPS